MKTSRVWLIGSFVFGLGYIFLGYFFYDWSFHMVPHTSDRPEGKIAWDLFTDLYFIALGILILFSSRLASMKKPFAARFYAGVFWAGLAVLATGQLGFSYFAYKGNPLEIFLLDMGVLLVLHIPALVLYLTRKNVGMLHGSESIR